MTIKIAYSSQTEIPNIFSAILLLHIRFMAQLDEMAKLFCKISFRDWIIIKNLHTGPNVINGIISWLISTYGSTRIGCLSVVAQYLNVCNKNNILDYVLEVNED